MSAHEANFTLQGRVRVDYFNWSCLLLLIAYASNPFAPCLPALDRSVHAVPLLKYESTGADSCTRGYPAQVFDMHTVSHYNYEASMDSVDFPFRYGGSGACIRMVPDDPRRERISCEEARQVSYSAMHGSCATRGEPWRILECARLANRWLEKCFAGCKLDPENR
jgi:hypothetical protein